jgi:nucleotide-binding universal stress UspA family protein
VPGTSPFELGTDGPTAILVGIDLSQTSIRAAAYAAGLARRQGSRLVAVYVAPLHPSSVGSFVPMANPFEVASQVETEIRRLMDESAHRIGIEVELHTAFGDPVVALCRVADQVQAELVVVGASQSAGHRYVGSIGTRLMRRARWPVLVVP